MEVLISFFILLIGVVSVICLFPVGIESVRNAVIDTRCTITALEAQGLVLSMGWPDDAYLTEPPNQGFNGAPGYGPSPAAIGQSPNGGDPRGVDPGTTPPFAGTRPANDIYTSGGNTIVAPKVNNVYATIMNADGTAPSFPANPTSPLVGTDVPSSIAHRFHPMAGAGIGFPVFVDPQLANSHTFQFDEANPMGSPAFKRINISTATATLGGANFASMAPFIGNLNDLVVNSLSEVQYQQSGVTGVGLVSPSQRDQFIRQHFFVQDEIHMEGSMVTSPLNPNRMQGTPLPGWRYVRSADSTNQNPTANPTTFQPPGYTAASATVTQTFNTASRNDAYTWAFVVRNRNLQPQPASGPPQPSGAATPPGLDCPDAAGGRNPYLVPKPGDYSNDNLAVLVFNKRAIGRGYHLIRGCLFNGCQTITLSWDPTIVTDAPAIRRGTWLMEATLSPGLRDTTKGPAARGGPAPLPENSFLMSAVPPFAPASGYVKYRHAVEFYRVASVQDPVPSQNGDGQVYQIVTLEQTVTNYPIAHVLGDGRALPDVLEMETFNGAKAYPNMLPGPPLVPSGAPNYASRAGADVNTVWVPIVVMHGLQEVYSVRN